MVTGSKLHRWTLAALLALTAAACGEHPLVPLRGRVLDPDSRQPLAGVRVSSRQGQTTTAADGGYTLPVAVGGRQLTFELAGRPTVQKFVILDEEMPGRTLDVLLPAAPPGAGPALALARSWSFAGELKDYEQDWESDGDSNLALSDRWGNDDHLLALGHGGDGKFTATPTFSGDGAFVFYALNVSGRETDVKRGVYRLPLAGGPPDLLPRIDERIVVDSLALSPDGAILLGAGGGDVYRFDRPAASSPAIERLSGSPPGTGSDLAWGPDDSLYLQLPDAGPLGSRVVRASWPDFAVDEPWGSAGGVKLAAPVVPLPDGSVIASGYDGGGRIAIFRRTPTGETTLLLARETTDVPVAADLPNGWLYYRARSGGQYSYDLHLRHLPSELDLVIVTGIRIGRAVAVAPGAFASNR